MTEFKTTHNLPFEVAKWAFSEEFSLFRVGTCTGLWTCTKQTYDILAIDNENPGNGHFEDVLEWFEHSCRRDNRNLRILAVINKRFMTHLMVRRGFKIQYSNNLIKIFHNVHNTKTKSLSAG